MSKSTLLKTIVIMIVILTIVIFVIFNIDKINIIDNKMQKVQEECEHDWVVTSEYDFIFNSYKTISKCSKCGKKV